MVEIQSGVPKNPKQIQAEQDAAVKSSLDKIKNKIIVMSGKGGVGKTSTSVNLSIALASKGHKVGIMDVDLHGPDVPRMLGLSGMPEVNQNKKLNPMRYSENLKATMVSKLATPGALSASALAEQVDIPQSTLSRWVREYAKFGKRGGMMKAKRPQDWTAEEKLKAVLL